jgi:GNAT superfamily N-acetyltransferase
MALKTRQMKKQPQTERATRKSKFQADLAPAEDRMVRGLKQELQLTSNTDFLSDALALFRWAVWERKRGHRIFSETETGERKELVFPRLERVAPELVLPRVEIPWAPRELESLADLASREPAHPTENLIRAMRGWVAVLIRRLEEQDEVALFDCGDEPLNNYLRRHAWANQQKSFIGVTYVAIDEGAPRTVIGYFTLATASVPRESFPKNYVRGLPPYDLPLVLLARLAVDRRFTGKGLGHALISEAFKIALRVADDVGCRCIITDAYRNRVDWYARYGFVALEGASESGPQRMFLDMRTIRMALKGTQ